MATRKGAINVALPHCLSLTLNRPFLAACRHTKLICQVSEEVICQGPFGGMYTVSTRIDLDAALSSFKQGIELPVILTCRPERQGGHYPGDEESRIEVLRTAIKSEVSWVDLEVDISVEERDSLMEIAKGKTQVIASHHSEEAPPPANEIISEIEDYVSYGDVVKMCYPISGSEGALRIFEAAWELRDSEIKASLMGIGSGGDWVRIHAPLLNQNFVYSTMQTGWHLSHSGKINVSDLATAWKLLGYA